MKFFNVVLRILEDLVVSFELVDVNGFVAADLGLAYYWFQWWCVFWFVEQVEITFQLELRKQQRISIMRIQVISFTLNTGIAACVWTVNGLSARSAELLIHIDKALVSWRWKLVYVSRPRSRSWSLRTNRVISLMNWRFDIWKLRIQSPTADLNVGFFHIRGYLLTRLFTVIIEIQRLS